MLAWSRLLLYSPYQASNLNITHTTHLVSQRQQEPHVGRLTDTITFRAHTSQLPECPSPPVQLYVFDILKKVRLCLVVTQGNQIREPRVGRISLHQLGEN